MANLTREQLQFLSDQNIPLSVMFDAEGLGKEDYARLMKDSDKQFAYGVTVCKRGHETLRSRSGHCIQCDTARIEFLKRNDANRDLFVAGSISKNLIKLGNSADVDKRLESINGECYGGTSDWRLLHIAKSVPRAGGAECRIAEELEKFRVGGIFYFKGPHRQQCYDLFSCAASLAIAAFARVVPETCDFVTAPSDVISTYNLKTDPRLELNG